MVPIPTFLRVLHFLSFKVKRHIHTTMPIPVISNFHLPSLIAMYQTTPHTRDILWLSIFKFSQVSFAS